MIVFYNLSLKSYAIFIKQAVFYAIFIKDNCFSGACGCKEKNLVILSRKK
ncbi:hypothetical protein SGRA_1148 [Saprospira grandis str. Lewin]|uniref:Uncharacterized protein n=1 Tax=Saprospira grandis (strain Lewin) TaxID=984262 RepID=H6L401_SAPGL|nr:hypothetical protein SGRA_1148 [Saprospira grandis str. Lewin]